MNKHTKEVHPMSPLTLARIFAVGGFMIIAGIAGCSPVDSNYKLSTPQYHGSAKIFIASEDGSPFSILADSAVADISADDMYTLSRPLTVADGTIEGIIENIPAGENRTVKINVFDSAGVLQYTGTATVDVKADQTVTCNINIIRVRGALAVNGTVIEQVEPEDDIVAFFPFNGNARDGSGLFNDGIVFGATLTTNRNGTEKSAYIFNGSSDYIEVPYNKALDCEDSVSVLLWARSAILGTEYTETAILLQIGTGSEQSYDILLNQNLDIIEFHYRCHWTGVDIIDGGVKTKTTLDTNWHFYAMTFDGDSLRGYVDGAWVGSAPALPGIITSLPLRIGCQSKSLARYWNGAIDDVRIYHRALSEEELTTLYSIEG